MSRKDAKLPSGNETKKKITIICTKEQENFIKECGCIACNDDICDCAFCGIRHSCVYDADNIEYRREKEEILGLWEPIVNSYGELTEFLCECGHGSTVAYNYCPQCGKKMDNDTIEKRIEMAIQNVMNCSPLY